MDFLDTPEKRDRRLIHLPMGRFGEAVELAKGALFCTFFEFTTSSFQVLRSFPLTQWLVMIAVI
jgi:hypothetical protein